jgi:TonB family protein
MKPGESVSLRNEQSGKEIQCKVLEAPKEGQPGYTDLEFVESVPDFWEGHAEQAKAAAGGSEVGVEKSDAESDAEEPEPAAAAEPEGVLSAEPFDEKPEPATVAEPEAVAPHPEAVVAPPEAHAHEETEAAADNSLAMMSATASEVKLPPVKAPEPEETPQVQKPPGRLREELVPAHEMVPANPTAPATSPAPSATVPTGEQIDAALRSMEGPADPSEAKDKANLAALMAREARLAKYAALKEKAATQIGRGPATQGASKGAEAAAGEAAASVEGEAGVEEEAGPPKAPLSERLTTGKNAVIVEIVAGVAIAVALGFIWHAVRGLIIHPSYRPAAVAAAPVKKAAPPKAPAIVVQTPAAPVAKVAAAATAGLVNAPGAKVSAARATVIASAPVAKVPAAKAAAETPVAVGSAPVAGIVPSSPARSEPAEETGPRVVEPPPVSEEPKPEAPVAPKAPENISAKIVSAPQPSFPSWAKKLDVGGVVKLDAVIDEKGNLAETKIVSGPRLLERAAEQAVQLWIFQPAELDGKPAASHMVLTVEFQR